MGCDIHLFVETKPRESYLPDWFAIRMGWTDKWKSVDKWELDNDYDPPRKTVGHKKGFYTGGRNYNLFTALCGVRSHNFHDGWKMVSEPNGVPKNVSDEVSAEIKAWGSDGHSHSYNTLAELMAFDWSSYGDTVKDFLDEVIPKLKALNRPADKIRIIYFFDN